MEHVILGRTGLKVSRTGFGCIPIQRISYEESTAILRRAYDAGITFFDTANAYTTSEEQLGIALSGVRDKIVIATKSAALSPEQIMANIDNSLEKLQTDYIDILQVHNPDFLPVPGGEDGVYDTLELLKKQGKIRHIGITFHRLGLAVEAIKSGHYDTLQFPLSSLSSDSELVLTTLCKAHNIGLIAMKGMCGGLLSNAKAAFSFLRQYDNVVPIWGIQKMSELEEFISYEENPPKLDDKMWQSIKADRETLGTSFCRGCGYCLPCSADVPINMAARITHFIRRFRAEPYLTAEWKANMDKVSDCTNCGLCKSRCPYGLDIPNLLKAQQSEYYEIYNTFHGAKSLGGCTV